MVSQTGRFASLVILLFAVTGCALQERKPMYDGWSLLATVPVANSEIAVAELDGKIYVVVGRLEGGFRSERTDGVEVFDPKTNQWSKRRSMLRPRGGVNGIAANGCFHYSAARAIRTIPTASIPITITTILLPTVEAPVGEYADPRARRDAHGVCQRTDSLDRRRHDPGRQQRHDAASGLKAGDEL